MDRKNNLNKAVEDAMMNLSNIGLLKQKYDGTYSASPGLEHYGSVNVVKKKATTYVENTWKEFKRGIIKTVDTGEFLKQVKDADILQVAEAIEELRKGCNYSNEEHAFKGHLYESLVTSALTRISAHIDLEGLGILCEGYSKLARKRLVDNHG